jgi:hypothetical protein
MSTSGRSRGRYCVCCACRWYVHVNRRRSSRFNNGDTCPARHSNDNRAFLDHSIGGCHCLGASLATLRYLDSICENNVGSNGLRGGNDNRHRDDTGEWYTVTGGRCGTGRRGHLNDTGHR